MKLFILLIITFLFCSKAYSQAIDSEPESNQQSNRWVKIITHENGASIFIDEATIQLLNNNTIQAWIKITPGTNNPTDSKYMLNLIEYKCSDNFYMVLQESIIQTDDSGISTIDSATKQYIYPESIMEGFFYMYLSKLYCK